MPGMGGNCFEWLMPNECGALRAYGGRRKWNFGTCDPQPDGGQEQWSVAQQGAIAALLEMPIVRQCFRDLSLLHDPEGGAVGQAPALVKPVAVKRQRVAEELRRLRNQLDFLIVDYPLSEAHHGAPGMGAFA